MPSRMAAESSALDVGLGLWFALVLIATLTPTPDAYARRILRLAPTDLRNLVLHAGGRWDLLGQLATNCIMFMPLGLLGPARSRWLDHPGRLLLVAATVSGSIEAMQFVLGIGRTTSTDDVWVNTVGALAGWGLFRFISKVRPRYRDTGKRS